MQSKLKKAFVFILAAISFVAATPIGLLAYETQFADNARRVPLKWKNGAITISLSNSLKQAANIKAGSDVAGAIERSLATWERAANIKFNSVWADKQVINATDSGGDGASLLTVAAAPENLASFAGQAADLAGRTRVFYTKRGLITEADIALNPYQQFSTDGSAGTYDLQATVTHEIGHLLGLDHSEVWAATMHPQQGKNGTYGLRGFAPRTLAEDDRAAIRSLYGAGNADCCGSIAGTLTGADGKSAGDLTVWAESEFDGKLIASTHINSNGSFQIGGLKAGKYKILAQSAASRATEIASAVIVEDDMTATINRSLNLQAKTFNFRLVGFNAQLSTVAVPVNAGHSYLIFAGGDFAPEELSSVESASPFLTVNQQSVAPQDFGSEVSVLSFQIDVAPDAPRGEYSLIFRKKNGETVYLLGAVTVDEVPNDFQHHFIGE